jgi:hypothetical protein
MCVRVVVSRNGDVSRSSPFSLLSLEFLKFFFFRGRFSPQKKKKNVHQRNFWKKQHGVANARTNPVLFYGGNDDESDFFFFFFFFAVVLFVFEERGGRKRAFVFFFFLLFVVVVEVLERHRISADFLLLARQSFRSRVQARE